MPGKFDANGWSSQLVRALGGLAEVQERFPDYLGETQVNYRRAEAAGGAVVIVDHFKDAFLDLYRAACFRKEVDQEERFVCLRSALNSVQDVLWV